ncbi:ATP-binding protein [Gracilinema caldarium]|uniref:ATP-binding protein n=1 Tax=Gracilinema caldarium TaxID=215591 RepID=UPI0026F1340D|nr:ATP-binding protein [Gracilinema caldarium]
MKAPLIHIQIEKEHHIVLARQRIRKIAEKIGLDKISQTRISTAVSEIARNAFEYAGGGIIECALELQEHPQRLIINVVDHGPGISNLEEILQGRYVSQTGMGMGIIGAKRLVDHFSILSFPGQGTTVELSVDIPTRNGIITSSIIQEIAESLSRLEPENLYEEIQRQNQELLRSMNELKQQQEELKRLNKELSDTNRGFLALYTEINEKNDALKHANEIQKRFLSNMSHEFRSPLNTIISLTRILTDRIDGDLTEEQEKQVFFIKKAAEDLSSLINDILDLGKLEAQKVVVKPAPIQIETLLSTLRGMLKPLMINPAVQLVIEDPKDVPILFSDKGKISQILRNLVSNAIKFTEHGEIRLKTLVINDRLQIIVSDTGIGIPKDKIESIFNAYVQVDNPLQKKYKGTGLGLSISRELAEILGGSLICTSEEGKGSTFTLEIPLQFKSPDTEANQRPIQVDIIKEPILLIEDDESTVLLYEKYLNHTKYQLLGARTIDQAKRILTTTTPKAILLDILLKEEDGWDFATFLKTHEHLKDIPLIITSVTHDVEHSMSLGAYDFLVKPIDRKQLTQVLNSIQKTGPVEIALVIDDDEMDRYVLVQMLQQTKFKVLEAKNGKEGLEKVIKEKPQIVFLDLMMPEMDGFQVLDQMKQHDETKNIPVIISTSKVLTKEEQNILSSKASMVLAKSTTSTEDSLNRIRQLLERLE